MWRARRFREHNNMYYVYVLESEDKKRLYKGMTGDLEKRLHQHELGQSQTTKMFGKFKLILVETFNTREEARKREKYLKSGVGREWLVSNLVR
ncbi:MAG: GIY-YIG nuclease family protein [Candidatus Roizmanbacteria bacterium]